MTPEFKNMKELTDYLETLKKRIEELEARENKKPTPAKKQFTTYLTHKNFLVRAFTVWGHFMAVNFIISGIGAIIYFCIVLVILNAITNPADPSTIPTPWIPVTNPAP